MTVKTPAMLDDEFITGDGQRWKVKAIWDGVIVGRLAHLEREAQHYLEIISINSEQFKRYRSAA